MIAHSVSEHVSRAAGGPPDFYGTNRKGLIAMVGWEVAGRRPGFPTSSLATKQRFGFRR